MTDLALNVNHLMEQMSEAADRDNAEWTTPQPPPTQPPEPPPPEPAGLFTGPDLTLCNGSYFLKNYPPPFDWILNKSWRKACLGLVIAAGGAGKGHLVIQLLVALASAGVCLDTWEATGAQKSIYISAEDDPLILHRRVHHALLTLPEDKRTAAAANIQTISVTGDVALYSNGAPTANLEDLRLLIERERPSVVALDTVSRFFAINENDNPTMTQALGHLEKIANQYQTNFLLIHHTSKGAGALANDKAALMGALEQTALRGYTALTASARWQLNLAPLSRKLACDLIGDYAINTPDGHFVAMRVCKKNAGHPENIIFAERDEHGLLNHVEATKEAKQVQNVADDALELKTEIERRIREGLDPLSASRAGRTAFGWGDDRNKRATQHAIDHGLLTRSKKMQGKGEFLALKESPECPTALSPESPRRAGLYD